MQFIIKSTSYFLIFFLDSFENDSLNKNFKFYLVNDQIKNRETEIKIFELAVDNYLS